MKHNFKTLLVIGFVVCVFALVIWYMCSSLGGVATSVKAIDDPIERGLSYVAVAIVIHAFFSGTNVNVTAPVTEREENKR